MRNKFDVQIALEGVSEAVREWDIAHRKFVRDVERLMRRLLPEAAAQFMSVAEVAQFSGFTTKKVRDMMRAAGLDPTKGKRLLAKQASEALHENSDLLGISPHQMDLTSPLAYLPMGESMAKELRDKSISQVTEVDDADYVDELVEVFQKAWHAADERGEIGFRTQAGIHAVLAYQPVQNQ